MTPTQNRRWIRSSVQEWLVATFPTVTFAFGDARTSIDDLLASHSPVVLVDWLRRSGTDLNDARTVVWPLQLTVVAKTTGDPYGTSVDGVVSSIVSGTAGVRIPIKDYTNPASPTTTSNRLIALNVTDDDLGNDGVLWVAAVTLELNYIEHK